MYTTRPLSLYQNSPEAMKLLPEGPNSGYLVLQADVSTPTYFFGMFKSIETIKSWPIKNLPFPQNKLLSISHGGGGPVAPVVDHVYMIPVINQPLSSNRYYVIKASEQHRGEAYASSKEEDIVTCCFCLPSITDEDPRPFDPDDVYQQFEFFVTDSSRDTYMPIAISLAPNGYPPEFLRSEGCHMKSKPPEHFDLKEAQGIDPSLRTHLPDFNFKPTKKRSKSVVIGKWYCPFMFIKDGRVKDQMIEDVFYEMTLEQRWERIYGAERDYGEEKMITLDVVVPTEMVRIAGQKATQEEKIDSRGVVWFKAIDGSGTETRVGLSSLIIERIMWEEKRVGWVTKKEKWIRVIREKEYEGMGHWKSFGCYMLVESFVLKRNNGSILLTYDFRHTHQIRNKWDWYVSDSDPELPA